MVIVRWLAHEGVLALLQEDCTYPGKGIDPLVCLRTDPDTACFGVLTNQVVIESTVVQNLQIQILEINK